MKVVHMCGTRGLGDIVASTSFVLDKVNKDTHIVFHYPEEKGYRQKFDVLMSEFVMPEEYSVTYQVDEGWSTVSYKVALQRFGKETENQDWYFSSKIGYGCYRQFKSQWIPNDNGPIGIVLSHMTQNGEILTEKNYPIFGRLWSPEISKMLEDLVDNSRYVRIGGGYNPLEIVDQIEKMRICKKVIGFDTAWAHIANCMRVPYVLCKNSLTYDNVITRYRDHPSLTIISEEELLTHLD
jgi:hypothetical protein